MTTPTIITRAGKGSALTWTEADSNFTNLQSATIGISDGANTGTIALNSQLNFAAGSNATVVYNPSTRTLTISSTGGSSFNPDSPGAIGGTTPSSGAFTTLSATTTNTTAAITTNYTPSTTSGAAILATGQNTQGGTYYFDFLKVTNTNSTAVNPNKTFRLNAAGGIEIINSAYTTTILSLTDTGTLRVGGTNFPSSTGSSGQVLTADGSGGASWSTPSSGGTTLPSQSGASGKFLSTDGSTLFWASAGGTPALTFQMTWGSTSSSAMNFIPCNFFPISSGISGAYTTNSYSGSSSPNGGPTGTIFSGTGSAIYLPAGTYYYTTPGGFDGHNNNGAVYTNSNVTLFDDTHGTTILGYSYCKPWEFANNGQYGAIFPAIAQTFTLSAGANLIWYAQNFNSREESLTTYATIYKIA